jgi:hypothetical protein
MAREYLRAAEVAAIVHVVGDDAETAAAIAIEGLSGSVREIFWSLHRFAAVGAANRYRAVQEHEVEDILALNVALRRNDQDWFEALPPEIVSRKSLRWCPITKSSIPAMPSIRGL